MKKFDLHVHSLFSDGLFSPEKLITQAIQNGLSGMAITDHDNIGAVKPARHFIEQNHDNFFFLPGVEFSTHHAELGEIHLLGYFPNSDLSDIEDLIKTFRTQRHTRLEKIIRCVQKQGFALSLKDFPPDSTKSWGRMHVARALVKKGFFDNTQKAFNHLLRQGEACYIPRKNVKTLKLIPLIQELGGFSVVAHPSFLYQRTNWIYLEELLNVGLNGIEIDHPLISPTLKKIILRDTDDLSLFYTGGSDFHGDLNRGKIGDHICTHPKTLEYL